MKRFPLILVVIVLAITGAIALPIQTHLAKLRSAANFQQPVARSLPS